MYRKEKVVAVIHDQHIVHMLRGMVRPSVEVISCSYIDQSVVSLLSQGANPLALVIINEKRLLGYNYQGFFNELTANGTTKVWVVSGGLIGSEIPKYKSAGAEEVLPIEELVPKLQEYGLLNEAIRTQVPLRLPMVPFNPFAMQ